MVYDQYFGKDVTVVFPLISISYLGFSLVTQYLLIIDRSLPLFEVVTTTSHKEPSALTDVGQRKKKRI